MNTMSIFASSIEKHSQLGQRYLTVHENISSEAISGNYKLSTDWDQRKVNEKAKCDDDNGDEDDESTISSMDDEQFDEVALEVKREKET